MKGSIQVRVTLNVVRTYTVDTDWYACDLDDLAGCVKEDVTDDPTEFINDEAPGDTFTVTVEELERFESDDEEEDSEEE